MLKRFLEASRFLFVLPVIGSLLLSVAVVVMGLGLLLVRGWDLLRNPEFNERFAKILSVTATQAINLFLVGALGYILAFGPQSC